MFFVIAYCIGLIPFGEIYAYLMGFGKLKKQGSGNIGASNAYRVGGKLLGILTLGSDILKGLIPVLFFQNEWTALAVVMGHVRFPLFTGGKGVATALGAFLAINPRIILIMLPVWILVFIWKRISSLSSIITFAILPVVAYYFDVDLRMSLITSAVILWAHKDNIMRLYQGTENKLEKTK